MAVIFALLDVIKPMQELLPALTAFLVNFKTLHWLRLALNVILIYILKPRNNISVPNVTQDDTPRNQEVLVVQIVVQEVLELVVNYVQSVGQELRVLQICHDVQNVTLVKLRIELDLPVVLVVI